MSRFEDARYSLSAVDRLTEGFRWDGTFKSGHWEEAAGSYLQLRARAETQGDIDEGYFCEMLDLDRALNALRMVNPVAAAIVTLVRDGWTIEEVQETFGQKLRTPAGKLLDKATCFLRAYMNGATMAEAKAAYARGRRPLRWKRDLP